MKFSFIIKSLLSFRQLCGHFETIPDLIHLPFNKRTHFNPDIIFPTTKIILLQTSSNHQANPTERDFWSQDEECAFFCKQCIECSKHAFMHVSLATCYYHSTCPLPRVITMPTNLSSANKAFKTAHFGAQCILSLHPLP